MSTHARIMGLSALALVPLVAAQEPVDFRVEHRAGLAAYYRGEIEGAIAHFERCVEPGNEASDLYTAAQNLSLAMEVAGRRDEALHWAGVARGGQDRGTLHWFLAQEALEEMRQDPRWAPIAEGLAATRERGLRRLVADARVQREELAAARSLHEGSVILWADGHSAGTNDMAFSPDSQRFVSASLDRTVRLRSVWIEEPPTILGIHSATGVAVEFSPDGERILVLDSLARTAHVYDGWSGDLSLVLHGGDEAVIDAALGPGGRAWTVTHDGQLWLWDTIDGQRRRAPAVTVPLETIDVLPGGNRIVGLGVDGRACMIDQLDGGVLSAIGPPGLSLSEAVKCGADRIYLRGADGHHYVHEYGADGVPVIIKDVPERVIGLPTLGGSRLMTMGPGKSLLLWDTRSGELVATMLEPGSNLSRICRDGQGIVAAAYGSNGDHACVFDGRTGTEIGRTRLSGTINNLALSNDGQLAIGEGRGIYIARRDGTGRSLSSHCSSLVRMRIGAGGLVASKLASTKLPIHGELRAPFSPDLPREFRRPMRVWDATTGRLVAAIDAETARSPRFGVDEAAPEIDLGSVPMSTQDIVRFSPDGTRMVRTRSHPRGNSAILTSRSGEILGSVIGLDDPASRNDICPAFIGPNGEFLLSPGQNGGVVISSAYDAETFEVLEGHTGVVTCMAFDSTGTRFVSSATDGTARIWAFEGRFESHAMLSGHSGIVWACAFSPDDTYVATGGVDQLVQLWNAETGTLVRTFSGHTGTVRRLAFHPTSGHLVSASFDGTLRIWDIESDDAPTVLEGHTAAVEEVDFTEDGRIVSIGRDATMRVWDGDSGRLLATRVEYDEKGWLTFEPGGRYVAEGRAEEWAQVEVRGKTFPLSSYADLLNNPDAVQRSLAGEVLPALPRIWNAPSLRSATPQLGEIDSPRVRISVTFEDDYGLDEIVIERDGEVWQRGLDFDGLRIDPGGRTGALDLEVPLADGRSELDVSVRATNKRRVKSRPIFFRRRYVPPAGDLYLVALAVSDYADDALDLVSPGKDAADLVARLRKEAGGLYREVRVRTLGLGGDPVVSVGALEELRHVFLSEAGPEDTILVFAAGHGARTESGDYYFLTSDATPARPWYGVPRSNLWSLVTGDQLQARRRLLLIDTCHAGEDFEPGKRGVGRQEAFSQDEVDASLDGSGIYIIAGSTALGAARETAGNGVFTRALLDGLEGAADDGRDGTIDIDELIDYASRVVREVDGPQRVTRPKVVGGTPFALARVR